MKFFIVLVAIIGFCCALKGYEEVIPVKDLPAPIGPEERIINGYPVVLQGIIPYQAQIVFYNSAGAGYFCGGSLLNNEWVLTAAHCVKGYVRWVIRLGTTKYSPYLQWGAKEYTSVSAIYHESYNALTLNNDVAVIRLPVKVEFSAFINPIQLPAKSDTSSPAPKSLVFISGWGRTSDIPEISPILKWAYSDVITNPECAAVFGNTTVISSTLCIKSKFNMGICLGDSGGPVVQVKNSSPILYGVVSFVSKESCMKGLPNGLARVTSFLTWINKKTGIPLAP